MTDYNDFDETDLAAYTDWSELPFSDTELIANRLILESGLHYEIGFTLSDFDYLDCLIAGRKIGPFNIPHKEEIDTIFAAYQKESN